MKIGIDARLFGTKHGGIGRYTQELIKNLEKIDSSNEYVILLSAEGFEFYHPQNPKFSKIRADFKVYGILEQLLYPIFLSRQKLDLVHFTHFNAPIFYPGRFIITIHDLIISHYPSSRATTLNPLFYKLKLLAYNYLVKRVTGRAQKIIAVSEFTKQDIIKLLKIPAEKIKVVYEGVDLPQTVNLNKSQILESFGLGDNFIIYVGSAYPHKNLEKLVFAFALVRQKNPSVQLVLAGRINYFYLRLQEEIGSSNDLENIIFTDYLSDEQLAVLYQEAKAYIFPSLIEGFGLPPLEAQSYGLPVVSSNSSCLPEILGASAVYFDPQNISEMAEKINLILTDELLRQKLITAGYNNLKKYSWSLMAEEILEFYKY